MKKILIGLLGAFIVFSVYSQGKTDAKDVPVRTEVITAKEIETALFPKTSFDENSVNPRVALKYDISEKVTLKANAGTGFRAHHGYSV